MIYLVFIANDFEGGVASFMRYLVHQTGPQFSVKLIATANSGITRYARINPASFSKSIEFIKFPYSPFENRYHVVKRLKRFISVHDILISDGGLELEMCSAFHMENPLVFVLHGDYSYYYDRAAKFRNYIDRFITINNGMSLHLKKLIPEHSGDIFHQWPPVPCIPSKFNFNETEPLKILYAGLIEDGKGTFDLPRIDKILQNENVPVKWTIIGQGEIDRLKSVWKDREGVVFTGPLENSVLLKEYINHDIIILPSRAESLGLVIVEGMKAGLVPLVTNFKTGVSEFIVNDQNGFLIEIGDYKRYAETIRYLDNHRDKLEQIGKMAVNTANELFDEGTNAENYLALISGTSSKRNSHTQLSEEQFSRLDKKWIPNFITILIRKIMHKIKS